MLPLARVLAVSLVVVGSSASSFACHTDTPPCAPNDARAECGKAQGANTPPPPTVECKPTSRSLLVSMSGVAQQIEGTVKSGRPVVVKYKGCDVEVLAGCSAPGAFTYQALTKARRVVRMKDELEVQAAAPLSFVSLKASLSKGHGVALAMWTVGRFFATKTFITRADLQGDCEGATHVVSGMQAGAYELATSSSLSGEAEASFLRAGTSVKGSSGADYLDSAGTFSACDQATGDEKAPIGQCAAALALEFARVSGVAADPAHVEPACPSDMALVRGGAGKNGVATFCIDRLEVTAGAIAKCAADGACGAPSTTSDWPGSTQPARDERSPYCNGGKGEKSAHPMNCIDKLQAAQYCEARGKRLPTQNEWVWAATGGSRSFPWGDATADGRACLHRTDGTCAAGSLAGGGTPEGILDLVGNVWELTVSTDGAPNQFLICGGAWGISDFPDTPRPDCPYWMNQNVRSNIVGFRCARTP